jgi:hypothetical protein
MVAKFVSDSERNCLGDRSRIPGAGAINQFDTNGKLIRRLMTGGVLASPFGMGTLRTYCAWLYG